MGKTTATDLTMRGIEGMYYLALEEQIGNSWGRDIASYFDTDQPQEDYPWLGAVPPPTRWDGERTVQQLRGDKIILVNDDYSTGIEFRRKDLRRDKTSQIQARIQDLATRVAFFPEKLLTTLLTANGLAYDGKAFFNGTHAIGDSGTIDNDIIATDGLAGGSAPTVQQQIDNIIIGLARMMGFKDDQGEPINENMREVTLTVPVTMLGSTLGAINSQFSSNGGSNTLVELAKQVKFRVRTNARLTATNQFYMFRTDAGIKPLIVQEELTMPESLGPDSEHAKKTNKVAFYHGWAGAVGYGRFEMAARLTTS